MYLTELISRNIKEKMVFEREQGEVSFDGPEEENKERIRFSKVNGIKVPYAKKLKKQVTMDALKKSHPECCIFGVLNELTDSSFEL